MQLQNRAFKNNSFFELHMEMTGLHLTHTHNKYCCKRVILQFILKSCSFENIKMRMSTK